LKIPNRPEKQPEPGMSSPEKIIALTGASGFVGKAVIQELAGQNIAVRALRHTAPLPASDLITEIPGSLDDPGSLKELVKGAECVVHIGGLVAARRDSDFYKVNQDGTENLIKAAETNKAKRFLYISSLAAREPQLSAYAASKLAGEDVLKESNLNSWDIIRPPAVYGPGDQQLLPLMALLKKRIGVLAGGAAARVSVIYVQDLARAIAAWVQSGAAHNQTYEIDDGKEGGYSWRELLSTAGDVMNINPVFITPPRIALTAAGYILEKSARSFGKSAFLSRGKVRELTHPDWVAGGRNLSQDVDWRPETDFASGIQTTLAWYKQEGLI